MTSTPSMDLVDDIRDAVLRQREDEVTNFFTNVGDLREFITSREPSPGVNVTIKMCCFSSERLSADNGSRVTLVNANAHGLFDDVQKDLAELNAINRKAFIAQITVWDAKKKTGSPRTSRVHFRPGAVYEFRQVHSVGFFSDIPKGSVQLDGGVVDRVVETRPPLMKRKRGDDLAGSPAKARALVFHDEEEKDAEGGDEAMPSPPRPSVTRSKGKQAAT